MRIRWGDSGQAVWVLLQRFLGGTPSLSCSVLREGSGTESSRSLLYGGSPLAALLALEVPGKKRRGRGLEERCEYCLRASVPQSRDRGGRASGRGGKARCVVRMHRGGKAFLKPSINSLSTLPSASQPASHPRGALVAKAAEVAVRCSPSPFSLSSEYGPPPQVQPFEACGEQFPN